MLTRKVSQTIQINPSLALKILAIDGDTVRIGVLTLDENQHPAKEPGPRKTLRPLKGQPMG